MTLCIKFGVLPGSGDTSLIPALGRQRQADLCEFEASLMYRVSSIQDRPQSYTENPCLEKPKNE
ncbi:hypothetical protein ACRRTK_013890 [Alexandromys fortis]